MTIPNAAEIENWNEGRGKSWLMLHERLDRQLRPVGHAAMDRAGFKPGDRVLDVGCGCGETSVEIAARVAPGRVLGVDVSTQLLDVAREAATANLQFIEADAQVHAFSGDFDVLFSRFGVMFFDDPPAAFANLRRALKPSGRLAFCCWRAPDQNDWLSLPLRETQHLLPAPPPGDPQAPGPFAFADGERVKSILASAGFADIAVERLDLEIGADSLEDSVFTAMRIGTLGTLLRQVDASKDLKRQVDEALRQAMSKHLTDGVVRLAASVWIVSARNPG